MNSSYIYGADYHYWAGVIAHEILHNLGYVHPDGYTGTLITSYQDCIHADRSGNFIDIDAAAKLTGNQGKKPMPKHM